MALRDQLSTVTKYGGVISTSDPQSGIVEVTTAGGTVQILIAHVSILFRWPIVGEYWIVVQENGTWTLDGIFIDPSSDVPLSALAPGEAQINATNIYDAIGNKIITTSYASQALTANGSATIDASKGVISSILLSANATSSTIVNPRPGQKLTLEWVQDTVGGRTYVWPSICKFAGGVVPVASTNPNYTDSVTFWYDGTHWKETNRAMAIR